MATHDYDIANQSGAAFRTDLNNALAAIVSNNSNSSQPSTRYAYMWWADTSAGVLKIRNSANDGWVELFQLDGTITLEDGNATTPGLAFRDDLNTGIFSSSADTFCVATGGIERMELGTSETSFNEDGLDVNFRIESDNKTHMFFIDAGNDRIGINESAPSTTLHIAGADGSTIAYFDTDLGGRGLKINTFTSGSAASAGVEFEAPAGAAKSAFAFKGASEFMRLDTSGNLGLGTSSPLQKLHVDGGSNDPFLMLQRSGAGDSPVDIGGIQFRNSANTLVDVRCRSIDINDAKLQFFVMNAGTLGEKMVLTNSGYLGIGITDPDTAIEAGGIIKGGSYFQAGSNSTASQNFHFGAEGNGEFRMYNGNYGAGNQLFFINSSGDVGLGAGSVTERFKVETTANTQVPMAINDSNNTSTLTHRLMFQTGGTEVGRIRSSNSATSYDTSASDITLKKNFEDWTENTLDLFKNINPQKFHFIQEEDTAEKSKGFIAQEMVDSFPEAYTKEDKEDSKYFFNPSGMVVYLMKAIQELEAKVASLEAA